MILSFKKKFSWGKPTDFEEKIVSGKKIHTIRNDMHGRWIIGRNIHFATGVRTKKYNCFLKAVCWGIQSVQINYHDPSVIEVIIDGELFYKHGSGLYCIGNDKMIELARNDGFDSIDDFFKFFNKDFQGKIIHWTSFLY